MRSGASGRATAPVTCSPARGVVPTLAVLLMLSAPGQPMAQPGPDPSSAVAAVEASYEALDYSQAEALARQALSRPQAFTGAQLVRLHTTLALLLYARNDALGSAEQFRAALSLDPNLTLDPVLVSPVTLAFFEETRSAFVRERAGSSSPQPVIRYVVVRDSRPGAALRSLVLPGWGQRVRGERARGWALTAAWTATLGAGVAAHVQRQRAREAYLEETDPALVDDRYATYNNWHRVRGGLLLGAGAVWAASVIDVLARGAPTAPDAGRVALSPAGAGLRLVVGL
jgi:hypothetical protein